MGKTKVFRCLMAFALAASLFLGVIAAPESTEASEDAATEAKDDEWGILPADSSIKLEEDTQEEEQKDVTLPHGTTNTIITEDMLSDTPPKDYKINTDMQADAKEGKYNAYFLKDGLQTVSIDIDKNNLNYMLQNAAEKPTVMTNSVTIGDQTIGYTGIKTKGSYTLQHSVTDAVGSDRFSFSINFGKYIKKKDYGAKQNFYGCRKISFNNFFFDKSMLKEFFALKLMTEMGVPTPQYGLAKLYINGEYYGVYAMVESLDSSILEQYYNVDDDKLSEYLLKPEGTNFIYDELVEDPSPLWEEDEETYADVQAMIPTVMDTIKKLNQLSKGTDFEDREIDVGSDRYLELLGQIMDVDEVVKYFAVHSFLCQMDNMFDGQKNFGMYVDRSGKILMVPWDYDLSFGCFFPCDSESTANFNLDIMYRLGGVWNADNADDLKEQLEMTYSRFPLFYVIYQNESLMDQYHAYMRDCSKVAALGGTIYSGDTYEPGYFNSYIEQMQDDIYEAAAEKLADNVYYMNGANQPQDCKTAFPNLAKIIAMRSVGVLAQTDGIRTTVCGNGCSLSTLGNAVDGWTADDGTISCVDAATGIFTTADYRRRISPAIIVKKLDRTDRIYDEIRQKIGCDESDSLVVYSIKDMVKPNGDYTVTVPLASAYSKADGEISFYSYAQGETVQLQMTNDDNLYSGTVGQLKYLAIVQKGGNELGELAGDGSGVSPVRAAALAGIIGGGAAVIVLIVIAAIVLTKKRRKRHTR